MNLYTQNESFDSMARIVVMPMARHDSRCQNDRIVQRHPSLVGVSRLVNGVRFLKRKVSKVSFRLDPIKPVSAPGPAAPPSLSPSESLSPLPSPLVSPLLIPVSLNNVDYDTGSCGSECTGGDNIAAQKLISDLKQAINRLGDMTKIKKDHLQFLQHDISTSLHKLELLDSDLEKWNSNVTRIRNKSLNMMDPRLERTRQRERIIESARRHNADIMAKPDIARGNEPPARQLERLSNKLVQAQKDRDTFFFRMGLLGAILSCGIFLIALYELMTLMK